MFRRNDGAAVAAGLLIGLVVILAVMGLLIYSVLGPDQYTPEARVMLYRNDAEEVYRADIELSFGVAGPIEHYWKGTVGGAGGLPDGDHSLRVDVWEGELTAPKGKLLASRTFDAGVPGDRESSYVLTLPATPLEGDGSIHVWGYVYWDGELIGQANWSVDPANGTMTEG